MNRNATNYWYMDSPIIGNVAALVNSSGAIQEGYTYRSYGQATVHTGAGNDETWFTADDPTATSSALANPHLFTGREWDDTISLQYNRARWYAPTPGRWFSPDPLGHVDGTNLYEYAKSKPVLLLDAAGLLCGITYVRGYAKPKAPKVGGGAPAKIVHDLLRWGTGGADFGPEYGYNAASWECYLGCPGQSNAPKILYPVGPPTKTWGTNLKDWPWAKLEYGPGKDTYCECASCDQIKDCIIAYSQEVWKHATYRHPTNNCIEFAQKALSNCCLETNWLAE